MPNALTLIASEVVTQAGKVRTTDTHPPTLDPPPHSASQGEWYLKGRPSHNCAAQPYTGAQGAAPLQPDRALLLHNHRLCTEMIF